MHSRLFSRVARAVLVGLALAAIVGQAAARPVPGARRSRGFNLFAGVNVKMVVNRVDCNINNLGEVCVDPTNSSTIPGGFWPRGTPDQYIFNSGLQLAGVIPSDAGFAWAGDTVGAYFMDPRGDQAVGRGITLTYSSIDPQDAANWPYEAYVRDTAIYAPALTGAPGAAPGTQGGPRLSASQQDMWMRAWDGDPSLTTGRTHPMGILVDQRGLAWNYPSGNEDILYFVYNFFNITATDRAVYVANLPPWMAADGQLVDQIVAVGQRLHDGVATTLGVNIPSGGFPINNMYAAFFMDPDVGDAGKNYSTAVLPFSLAVAYQSNFAGLEGYVYPPDIFGAPFAAAMGFVGVKYLKSPVNPATGQEYGLTMFSNTLNTSTGFPDPTGVIQLWRYLSGNINTSAGDNACTVLNPIQRRLCYLAQNATDTRFYQSSGPFTLEPGQVQTIVVAYVHAAPVAAPIISYIGTGDLKPGIPSSGVELLTTAPRTVDSAVGWLTSSDGNANGQIDQQEVQTVPRSLLAKSLVAQAVFDNKFLLPFAPEPPAFFLVPGDNQVSVVWEPSPTEQVGDPYYAVAGAPTVPGPGGSVVPNPLFDPDFRQFDVEGYRIYRGRTGGNLALIAQYDYATTTFVDYTAEINYGQCAPELGVYNECPVHFDSALTEILPTSLHNDVPIVGNVVQVPPGGRVQLAGGSVFVVKADTAVTGGNSGKPELKDTGVPFSYIDKGVINSLTYFYAVTAFDVNSFASGPSSLESPPVTKSVTPRALSTSTTKTSYEVVQVDKDGNVVPRAEFPTMNADDGTFNGNMPPVNAALSLSAAIELLAQGNTSASITGITVGYPFGGLDNTITMSFQGDTTMTATKSYTQPEASADIEVEAGGPVAPYDPALESTFGVTFSGTGRGQVNFSVPFTGLERFSSGSGVAAFRFGDIDGYTGLLLKSRWFDDGGSEIADPTIVAVADSAHHAGTLSGVGRIFSPQAYRAPSNIVAFNFRGMAYLGSTVYRSADFVVEWGANGAVTITDVSNGVDVPFQTELGAGYGFIDPAAFATAGVAPSEMTECNVVDLAIVGYCHFYRIGEMADFWEGGTKAPLTDKAVITGLDFNADGVQDGQGIAFLLNGEPWMMEMAALPAAGTKWHLRSPAGEVSASCNTDPDIGVSFTDCGSYQWTSGAGVKQAAVPGLTYQLRVTTQYAVDPQAQSDLTKIHTVPDPYYVTSNMETTTQRKILKFVNLPAQCVIRIYSLSGVLVNLIEHNDPTGGGEATWNVRNRNQQFVASGVYFYEIEVPDGRQRIGRFTVVNYAQ
jgi:hypothetical protein